MTQPVAGRGPVYHGDFPDPFVLRDDDGFYAYATNARGANVQVLGSADAVAWDHLGDALPTLPPWAVAGRTWSPSALRRQAGYVLYYTVHHGPSGRQCISVATADRASGPFVDDSPGPLLCQLDRGGSIDPSPFVDRDGTAYLLWKSDDNAIGRRSTLWACRLEADGLSLAGDPVPLLHHDRRWERPLIEAPSLALLGGVYHLFYSANWWESANYAIGYAVGDAPLGPYSKVTTSGPWVGSHPNATGPGGQEVFTGPGGETLMAYHAWTPDRVGYSRVGRRSLRIAHLSYVGDRPLLEAWG